MASLSQQPTRPPTNTTIHDLGDDLLLAIVLRLPSLPSLIRAAFACRSFLDAIRSSPSFHRRFRELHPPPLLGLFFKPYGPNIPSFAPLRCRSDPDLAATVRGADFFLTRVPATDDASPGWRVMDCHGGYLFLLNSEAEETPAYNPITRVLHLIALLHLDGVLACHSVHLIYSNKAPGPFRVVCVFSNESRVHATVFSSCTREWRGLPWEELAPEQQGWLPKGKQVNGSLYWAHKEQAYMMVLDTATLQFSSIDLPQHLKGKGHLYRVGESKDGKLCIVYGIKFEMFVWYRGPDADGADKWKLSKIFRLEEDVLKAMGVHI